MSSVGCGNRRGRSQAGQDALDLEQKAAHQGCDGFGLEDAFLEDLDEGMDSNADHHGGISTCYVGSGIYGGRKRRSPRMALMESSSSLRKTRLFPSSNATAMRTPASTARNSYTGRTSLRSRQSRFSRASNMVSNAQSPATRTPTAAVHIVCAISENLARESCVSSIDAGTPVALTVTKQANGQTYAETIAYLSILQPQEILLNEGRRTSPLTRKILEFYEHDPRSVNDAAAILTNTKQSAHESKKRKGLSQQRYFSGNSTMFSATPPYARHEEMSKHASKQSQRGRHDSATIVKFISRSYFDQNRGAEMLRNLARKETYDSSVLEEFILLSSAHAVLAYTQTSLGAALVRNCLFLSVNTGGNNRMALDRSTILQLELLVNSKTGKANHSLVGTIDKTKTTLGSRLLRTNLMSPPTDVDTINSRLDLVDAFLGSETFFFDVFEHLSRLPNIDKMLSTVALVPNKANASKTKNQHYQRTQLDSKKLDPNYLAHVRLASKGISALVCIKSCLSALPSLARVLESQLESISTEDGSAGFQRRSNSDEASLRTDANSLLIGLGGQSTGSSSGALQPNHLLRAITFAMTHPSLSQLLQLVSEAFTPSTDYSRNADSMRHQECFALKAEEGGVISVLRKAFLSNVYDIFEKADKYAELHGLSVSVKYSGSRGYFLAIPRQHEKDLPQIFLQPSISGRFIHCTTAEVHSLNVRSRENVHDLLLLTFDRTQQVLEAVREHYDALAALCDAIALLDMCHAFADTVSLSTDPWCRPILTLPSEKQPVMIRNGRFGIDLSNMQSDAQSSQFVANDTFANDKKPFTIITGINGSGKSFYLKQLAIIVVLSHVGSYIPAVQASIPIRDRLCARIGNTDDQENNVSTFMQEMKEVAFICNHATENSMLLIDELGRATSNEDGVALAWAVAEYVLKKRAITFFVTHYPQLIRLAETYPSVQNIHLDSVISGQGLDSQISYTHKIKMGACQMGSNYGIKLAGSCGWPRPVVEEAIQVEAYVEALLPKDGPCEGTTTENSGRQRAFRTIVELEATLKGLAETAQPQSFSSFQCLLQDLHHLHLSASGQGETDSESLGILLQRPSSTTHRETQRQPNRDESDGTSSLSSSDTSSSESDDSSN